jgi:hypothetical protein
VNQFLQLPDWPNVWGAGDCACVPDLRKPGKFQPPTAQHAMREGRLVAQNIVAVLSGRALKPFSFKSIGLLASLGRRTGVARIFGFNLSGFFAWWLWRTIYLSKLPGLDKKVRVAFEWTLDLLFRKDVCAVRDNPGRNNFYNKDHGKDGSRDDGHIHERPTPRPPYMPGIPPIMNDQAGKYCVATLGLERERPEPHHEQSTCDRATARLLISSPHLART